MYQISLSGGMGSAITTLAAHEKGLAFNLIFADTLIEDDDLYRFVIDIVCQVRGERPSSGHSILYAMTQAIPPLHKMTQRRKYLKVIAQLAMHVLPDFVWLIDGRTPWDVYVDRKWVGNTRTAHCSSELKNEPVRRWLDEHSASDEPLVLGMDWSEMDRIERAKDRWQPRPVVSLLNDLRVERPEYDLMLNRYGIAKPRLYGQGFSHNNCGGFCCKAGLRQFERLHEQAPATYAYHEGEMERVLEAIGPTAKPFLRKTEDKELTYLTLREYRQRLEAHTIDVPEFDAEGCGCFTDE